MVRDMLLKRREQHLVEISNDVDKYFAYPFEDPRIEGSTSWIDGKGINQDIHSFQKVANDVFSIPSSTMASENAFSLSKRVVDPFRSCLTPKMVEALMCSSDWLRAE